MMNRSSLLLGALAFLGMAVAGDLASAGEKTAFDRAQFEAEQARGAPILVDIAASWCPVCRAQGPIIDKIVADAAYGDLKVFEVDFDSQKDVVRSLGAFSQSTLIMFRGRGEMSRSVGVTDPADIERLVRTAY